MDFTKNLIEEYEQTVVEAKKRKKKKKSTKKPTITYTTGCIGLNLDFFNKELNQDKINDFLTGGKPSEDGITGSEGSESSGEGAGDSAATGGEGGAMGESLTEAPHLDPADY
jgi:hypothetical protein